MNEILKLLVNFIIFAKLNDLIINTLSNLVKMYQFSFLHHYLLTTLIPNSPCTFSNMCSSCFLYLNYFWF